MTTGPRFAIRTGLGALVDRRLPGGCDDCHAYQIVTRLAAGVFVLEVHHDETCPELNGATQ